MGTLSAAAGYGEDFPAFRVDVPGLDNVLRLSERVMSGAAPAGEAGFRALAGLGVRTIVSVDGMKPDVAAAGRHGMRYVHLPIGYDGVPHARALELARAFRDLPGIVYVHCHHGKHRGPAAAALGMVCGGTWSAEQGAAYLRLAGTAEKYEGLYASVAKGRVARDEEWATVDVSFPATATVPPLAEAMVEVDLAWERIARARAAGWRTPEDHPDVIPSREAVQVAAMAAELGRAGEAAGRPAEFRATLGRFREAATRLAEALRRRDEVAAEAAFRAGEATCADCHARWRDRGRGR